jgi:hypothetical protein
MRHDHHHRTSTEKIEDEPSHHYEGDVDPHDEVVRLEALIEELAAKVKNCRKFILASRIATWGGGIVLFAMLVAAIRFDLGIMAAAVSALFGGIVVWGSNRSTANEAANEMAVAEADRTALITMINPRAIPQAHAAHGARPPNASIRAI